MACTSNSAGPFVAAIILASMALAQESHQERSTKDRNPNAEWRVHVVYAVPSDYPDRKFDMNGKIAGSIELMQQWLERESGGKCKTGLRLRFDQYSEGGQEQPDITFLRLHRSESELAEAPKALSPRIAAELAAAGMCSVREIYLVYYDGSHPQCAEAGGPPTFSASDSPVRGVQVRSLRGT